MEWSKDERGYRPHHHDLVLDYQVLNPGGHFFTPSTMRFFGSRLGRQWFRRQDGAYVFVTSEKDRSVYCAPAWGGERRYSVRIMDREGWIETVGEFGGFSYAVANRVARDIARHGAATWNGGSFTMPEGGKWGDV